MRYGIFLLAVFGMVASCLAGGPNATLLDLSGDQHDLRENPDRQVRAIVFLSTECPIARSYTKTLNRLAESLREDGRAELFGVVSDRATSRGDAKRHFDEYRADFPVLFDASGLLAGALEPVAVPEAFVLDPQGVVRYRGAIDDAWGAIGRRRPRVSRRYLEEAIASVVRGETPEPASTRAVGCLFETPAPEEAAPKVTYYRDIAPIMQARCEGCHRAGQVAPFALSTYEQAVKRSRLIEYVTHERLMPPWGPAAGAQPPLVGDRRLSDAEIALLSRWVADGSPPGDEADAPTPVEYADGWRLGEPDLVVEMPEAFSVPA